MAARIEESIAVKQAMLADAELLSETAAVGRLFARVLGSGGKVLFFGNGGSAADAQHLAAELVGRFGYERPGVPSLALTVDTSCLTAVANDYGFEFIFARQVQALGAKGDVAVGISTSGNSPNVLAGLRAAAERGLHTVALTGAGGGRMRDIAEHTLAVPSGATPRIQESHILLGHILCEYTERELFPR